MLLNTASIFAIFKAALQIQQYKNISKLIVVKDFTTITQKLPILEKTIIYALKRICSKTCVPHILAVKIIKYTLEKKSNLLKL
jgi:hypothetical protein